MKKIVLYSHSKDFQILENIFVVIDNLRKTQKISNVGNYDWDFGTGRSMWSDEMFKIFEVRKTLDNTISATKILDLIHPDDLSVYMNNTRLAIDGKKTSTIKYRIITPKGTVKLLMESGETKRSHNGDSIGLLGLVQDVTENEQLLHQLEERQKGVNLSYYLEQIQKTEQDLKKILERTVNILPGGWQYPEIAAARIKCNDCEVSTPNFKKTKWLQSEEIFINDKSIGWVEVVYLEARPEEDEGPFSKEERDLIKFIATQLGGCIKNKQTLQKLHESELKYRELFESAEDAIFIADIESQKIIDCNNRAITLTGYSKKEILAMKPANLHPSDKVKGTMEAFRKQSLGSKIIYETEILKKDKKTRIPVSINTSLIEVNGKKYMQGVFRDISIETLANERIKESEEKLKLIYNTSSDAIMTLEPPTWRFTSGNNSIVKMFGVKNEAEFLKLGPWDLSPKFQPDGQLSSIKAKKMIAKAIKNGFNFFEWTHKKYKGENFFALVLLNRINFHGKTFLNARVQDISEQKQAEIRLKESEEKYSKLVESGNDGIILIQNWRLIFANNQMAKMTGYSIKEILNTPFLKYIHLDDRKKISTIHQLRLDGKQVDKIYEASIVTKKRKKIFIEINAELINYDGGVTTLVFIRDITQRKIAEQKIIQSEDKYRDLFYNAPIGFHSFGSDQKFIAINQSELDLLGYTRDEIINKKTFKDLIDPTDYSKFKKHWNHIKKGEESGGVEYIVIGKDRKKRYIVLNDSARFDEQGKFVSTRGAMFDITRRKAIEKSLEIQKENAQKYLLKLEESNELKNVFVSIASHQLRTPLGIMRWSIEMIMNDELNQLSPRSSERIKSIYDNNIRLITLLEDLLNIGRIEEKKIPNNPILVDANSLIKRVVKELQILADAKKIQLKLDIDDKKLVKTYIDENHFMDVVYNVVVNAITYSKLKGSIKIISFVKNNYININVVDNGIGIPKSEQSKIFEKFFRASNATKNSPTGTGLGLAIVKSYIIDWGGDISFKSKPGKGTTFYIKIPIKHRISSKK